MRYGHVTRPTELALRCPRCNGLARATQPAHAKAWSVGDCSPEWGERWGVACERCPHRASELPWEAMHDAYPLYFVTQVGQVELWAWNRDHLGLIVHILEGGDASDHPLGYFATYLQQEWLRRTRRLTFAKVARRLLEGS